MKNIKTAVIAVLGFIVALWFVDYLMVEIAVIQCTKGGKIRMVDGEWKTFDTAEELIKACRGIDTK